MLKAKLMPRPKKDNPLRRVTVSVDSDDYHQMEELARHDGRSTACLIRLAMKDFLTRHCHNPSARQPSKEKQYG